MIDVYRVQLGLKLTFHPTSERCKYCNSEMTPIHWYCLSIHKPFSKTRFIVCVCVDLIMDITDKMNKCCEWKAVVLHTVKKSKSVPPLCVLRLKMTNLYLISRKCDDLCVC